MTRTITRLLWTLYPSSLRRRFAGDLRRDLDLRGMQRRGGVTLVIDAFITLIRAWSFEANRSLRWVGPGTDLRVAVRGIWQAPGYAFVVVSILALALGGNAAVFSVAHAVLLKGLPYGSPERVVAVQPTPLTLVSDGWFVDPDFVALEQVEAAALYVDNGGANLSRDGGTARISLAQVTEDFFHVLGVDALIGRERMARDEQAVVLSHAFWVQSFAGDPAAIGAELELNGTPYRVVGIMPAGVAFPSPVDLWLPFPTNPELYSSAFGPDGLALLADGADVDALSAIVEDRVRAQFLDVDYDPPPVRVTPLRDVLTGEVRTPLLVLLAISALVVLLGCLNLAGLVLSRNAARLQELRMRRALGAGRARLFGQLMLEVSVLAALGGVASVATATGVAGLLRRMLPGATPGLDGAALNLPVLGFVAASSAFAALTVGFLPALQGALVRPQVIGGHAFTQDRRSKMLQGVLVVGQVALAFALVAGAGLLGRSLSNLNAVPLGYDLEHVLTFQVRLPQAAYPDSDSRRAYLDDLQDALRGVAGVSAVGSTSFLPQQVAMGMGLRASVPGVGEGEELVVIWVQVDRDYFRAMGVPVLQGEPFGEPGSHATGMDRLVINESLARRLFPGGGQVAGRTITLRSRTALEARVEAVVGDVRLRSQRSAPTAIVYTEMDLAPSPFVGLAVRASGDPAALADAVRGVAAAIDRRVAPFAFATTGQSAARQIAVEAAVARLAGIFSASALLLAALGLFGLVSQSIARRRRELGIRLAIGARPASLMRRAMAAPLVLTAVGLLLGAAAAAGATGRLAPLLFEVSPHDPLLFAGVALAVVSVAALASFLSARAVLDVDAVESLRSD